MKKSKKPEDKAIREFSPTHQITVRSIISEEDAEGLTWEGQLCFQGQPERYSLKFTFSKHRPQYKIVDDNVFYYSLVRFANEYVDPKYRVVAIIYGLFNGVQNFAAKDSGLRDIDYKPTVMTVILQKKAMTKGNHQ
jgi:hypothetical protein